MEPKKNPKADISRNTPLFFALGLSLMMFLSYTAINWKVYEKNDIEGDTLNVENIEIEEDFSIPPPPPPEKKPPPPPPPEIIEVIEDDEEVEETVIKSTETDQEEEIEIDDVEIEEVEEDVDVPFFLVESAPIFKGCERAKDKKKCMSEKIAKFVNRKFNTDLAGDLGLNGRLRISTVFRINKNGDIVGVQARAPHPRLAKEAERVINLLPKMQPGKQRGVPVNVTYSLPIIFQVQD